MNINIRLLRESEVETANEVYNLAYGNIRPNDFFKWEFLNGPSGKAIYVIAEDLDREGNKIIGTQSAIPIEFIGSDNQTILTAKSEDTYVHPDYRGQKLFERMYDLLFEECKRNGISYLWGFTYARKPFLKLGFEIPFETIQGLYVKSILKSFNYFSKLNSGNKLKDKFKIGLLILFAWGKRHLTFGFKRLKIDPTSSVEKSAKVKLIEKIIGKKDVKFSIKQNDKFINWRIKTNPYKNDYNQFEEDSRFCITTNSRDEGFSYIEEILLSDSLSEAEKKQILTSTKDYLLANKDSFCIRFWGFASNQYHIEETLLLKKIGFVFVKKGTAFVWKDLGNSKITIRPEELLISRIYTQGNR